MESDQLCIQANAYLDNRIDVQVLLADSEIKAASLKQIAELEESLAQVHEALISLRVTWSTNYLHSGKVRKKGILLVSGVARLQCRDDLNVDGDKH